MWICSGRVTDDGVKAYVGGHLMSEVVHLNEVAFTPKSEVACMHGINSSFFLPYLRLRVFVLSTIHLNSLPSLIL